MTFPSLETARLRIVAFGPRHLTDAYVGWLNDPDVVRYSEQRHRRHTLESCRAHFESFDGSPDIFLAIESVHDEPGHIGNMTVTIDPFNGLADIAILIGEQRAWGKGLGLEAWSAVLATLLSLPSIRKVTAGAIASNAAMVAIMRNSGMREDGARRDHLLVDGMPVDVVHYAAWPRENSNAPAGKRA